MAWPDHLRFHRLSDGQFNRRVFEEILRPSKQFRIAFRNYHSSQIVRCCEAVKHCQRQRILWCCECSKIGPLRGIHWAKPSSAAGPCIARILIATEPSKQRHSGTTGTLWPIEHLASHGPSTTQAEALALLGRPVPIEDRSGRGVHHGAPFLRHVGGTTDNLSIRRNEMARIELEHASGDEVA